ncbi:MAG: DUF3737 family protein [Succinivibrio sp.]|nr:DUF3737 family protein [Succinivibrio sp.]
MTNLRLEQVVIEPGESAIKESSDISAVECEFNGKYPFWHVHNFEIERCQFNEGARAALWYSSKLRMRDTKVLAPKMFREMSELSLENVSLPNALETLWFCREVRLRNVQVEHGDYLLLGSSDIQVDNLQLNGNYSFQKCRKVTVKNSVLHSKDAFWETEDVVVENCILDGEYLGWHSKNLRLVNCTISGTQPLCYAENLVLENCSFSADADLAFEYSAVRATIQGPVHSIKNPLTGHIKALSCGQIILDENLRAPGDCVIELAQSS